MFFPLGLKLIFLIFSVLISVAFFTLYERKVLSYSQKRKGPNILGFKGILQPFSDAIKLFTKEPVFLNSSNIPLMVLSPILSLGLTLTLWLSCPSELGMLEISLGVVFVLCCLSAGVYPTLGAGWSSNSKYSLLGGLRAVAQTISYEVSLAITLLSFIILSASYSMDSFFSLQGQWFLTMVLPLASIWFVSCLAETNRTPFDFSEGESELVSGFNTEYSGGGFALFFLAEYGSILFMSMFFALVFMGGEGLSLMFALKTTMVAFLFIWVRSTLPRFRYDKLMSLAWKVFLPVTLGYFMFFVGFKLFVLVI